jgi:hypothetical protein
VPTQIGLLALADAGRVWADGTESTRVHAAAGRWDLARLLRSSLRGVVDRRRGREGTRWYLTTGLPY